MAWFSAALELPRKVDRVLLAEAKHSELIKSLRERVATLEADRALLIVEAKAAAASAASLMASHSIADLARRIGVLEEQLRRHQPSVRPKRLTDD